MTSASLTPDCIERTFTAFEHAAAHGLRAPMNNTNGVRTDAATQLAFDGRIKIEIGGHNWRRVTILTGPHAGKATRADPLGGRIYKIIDADGVRMIRQAAAPPRRLRTGELATGIGR
jgi:hypothetical protein